MLNFLKYLGGIYNLKLPQSNTAHYSVIQSIYDEFIIAENDIRLARLEMSLSSASGYWLECFGKLFKVNRLTDESDDDYRERILDSVRITKNSISGLTRIISDVLSIYYETVPEFWIEETWKAVVRYSDNAILSDNALFSNSNYRIGLNGVMDTELADYCLIVVHVPDLRTHPNNRVIGEKIWDAVHSAVTAGVAVMVVYR